MFLLQIRVCVKFNYIYQPSMSVYVLEFLIYLQRDGSFKRLSLLSIKAIWRVFV